MSLILNKLFSYNWRLNFDLQQLLKLEKLKKLQMFLIKDKGILKCCL